MTVEIIDQPYSGHYKEIIYDVESPWNSSSWTWVKFTDADAVEIVGQFRGAPKTVKYSQQKGEIIVLTSDHIFRLNASDVTIIETIEQGTYKDIIVAPDGTFIFHDNFQIERLDHSLSSMTIIKSPIDMEFIKFKNWQEHRLEFTFENPTNNYHTETLTLDARYWKIQVKSL